jgi:hypothetical protein
MMTMTKHYEQLPRPAAELEQLAEYYDTTHVRAILELAARGGSPPEWALGRLIPGHAPRFVRDEYDGSRLGPAPRLMT